MSRFGEIATAFFIIGAALLAAVAVLLVPVLFDSFDFGRFTAVVVLAGSALTFAVVARRSLRRR